MIARSLEIATYLACAGSLVFQLVWIVGAAYGGPL